MATSKPSPGGSHGSPAYGFVGGCQLPAERWHGSPRTGHSTGARRGGCQEATVDVKELRGAMSQLVIELGGLLDLCNQPKVGYRT